MHKRRETRDEGPRSRGCCGVDAQAGLDADDAPVTSLSSRSKPSSERGVLRCRSAPTRPSPFRAGLSFAVLLSTLARMQVLSAYLQRAAQKVCPGLISRYDRGATYH